LKRSIFFAAGFSQNPDESKLRSAFLNALSAKMWRRVSPVDTNPGDPDAFDIADAEIAPFLSAPFPTSLHRYAEYVALIRGDLPYEEISDATVQVVTDYWARLDEEQRLSFRSWNIPWIHLVPEIANPDDEFDE